METASADPADDRRGAVRRPVLSSCPVCDGRMEVVYQRHNQQVTICTDCHSGLTVPSVAWQISRDKRARQEQVSAPALPAELP